MDENEQHFLMKEEEILKYVRTSLDFFPADAKLSCEELGNGHINYVFRVMDTDTQQSIIIKHADVRTRSQSSVVSVDRIRIESEALTLQGKLAPGFVPKVYKYDEEMACLIMEDLKGLVDMRYSLHDRKVLPTFAEDMSTFLAETLIRTTDFVLTPVRKKELLKRFINPTLCAVSERKVFTDPCTNFSGRNTFIAENETFLRRYLYEDPELLLAFARLKTLFMTKAQALLHGDLHTGSVMVDAGITKVLDPEFAFFGPIGYDVGNIMAHLMFAWVNAAVSMPESDEKEAYIRFLNNTIQSLIDLFKEKAIRILNSVTVDPLVEVPQFVEWYLTDVLTDSAGLAGSEMIRRISGSAKAYDILELTDPMQRAVAERICVMCAREMILSSSDFQSGRAYVDMLSRMMCAMHW